MSSALGVRQLHTLTALSVWSPVALVRMAPSASSSYDGLRRRTFPFHRLNDINEVSTFNRAKELSEHSEYCENVSGVSTLVSMNWTSRMRSSFLVRSVDLSETKNRFLESFQCLSIDLRDRDTSTHAVTATGFIGHDSDAAFSIKESGRPCEFFSPRSIHGFIVAQDSMDVIA